MPPVRPMRKAAARCGLRVLQRAACGEAAFRPRARPDWALRHPTPPAQKNAQTRYGKVTARQKAAQREQQTLRQQWGLPRRPVPRGADPPREERIQGLALRRPPACARGRLPGRQARPEMQPTLPTAAQKPGEPRVPWAKAQAHPRADRWARHQLSAGSVPAKMQEQMQEDWTQAGSEFFFQPAGPPWEARRKGACRPAA